LPEKTPLDKIEKPVLIEMEREVEMKSRSILKSSYEKIVEKQVVTPMDRNIQAPPVEKIFDLNSERIDLPETGEEVFANNSFFKILKKRRSRRNFKDKFLSLEELGALLWSTQGVQKEFRETAVTLRPVPSAGAKHPFETYLIVNRVKELKPGVYRYLSLEHQLLFLFEDPKIDSKLSEATFKQDFIAQSGVVFVWSCIPFRTEWKYGEESRKYILIDAGHVAQNLYLAAEAMGCGTCAIGAYYQEKMDALLGLDGEEEFVIYMAPVGKK
jgi:SagB-type dehydrogenase family enzyme